MRGRHANPLNHGRSWSDSFRERYYSKRDPVYQAFCAEWEALESELIQQALAMAPGPFDVN